MWASNYPNLDPTMLNPAKRVVDFVLCMGLRNTHSLTLSLTHHAMEPAAKIGHAALQNAGKEKGKNVSSNGTCGVSSQTRG